MSSSPPLRPSLEIPNNLEKPLLSFNITQPVPRSASVLENIHENYETGYNSFILDGNEYRVVRRKHFDTIMSSIPIQRCLDNRQALYKSLENYQERYGNSNIELNQLKTYVDVERETKRVNSEFLDYFTNHVLLKKPELEVLDAKYRLTSDGRINPIQVGEDFSQFNHHDIYSRYGSYYNCLQLGFAKIVATQTVFNCRRELAEFRSLPLHYFKSERKADRYWTKYEKCLMNSVEKTAKYNAGL